MDFLDNPRQMQRWKQTVPRQPDKASLQTGISSGPKFPTPQTNLSRLFHTDLAPSVGQFPGTIDPFWSYALCGTPPDVLVERKDGQTVLRTTSSVGPLHSQTTSGSKQGPCERKLKHKSNFIYIKLSLWLKISDWTCGQPSPLHWSHFRGHLVKGLGLFWPKV